MIELVRDPVREAVASQIERESRDAQAAIVRNAMAEGEQTLEKRYQFSVSFAGELVKVFTVNGLAARMPVKDGGMGTIDFTMGMNGWAAGEPEYLATDWCFEDEVCLHNLLADIDFLVTMVHEVTERWAMKWLKMTYEDAHDKIANPCELLARDYLFQSGFKPYQPQPILDAVAQHISEVK